MSDMYMGCSQRDEFLKSKGYATYDEYLVSPLWLQIRNRFLRNNPECIICKAKPECVHHNFYTKGNLMGNNEYELIPLCIKCHKTIEFENGEKLTIFEVREKLNRLSENSDVYIKVIRRKSYKEKGPDNSGKTRSKKGRRQTDAQCKSKERANRKLQASVKEQERLAERDRHLFK